jgi:alpha-N-arabinofuranosidase
MKMDESMARMKNDLVNTELLGEALIPKQRFENPDGTELTIDKDYTGKKRNIRNPSPGPFHLEKEKQVRIKVWPK